MYLEKVAYIILGCIWVTGPIWSIYVFISILFSKYYYFSFIYIIWMIYDTRTIKKGGRPKRWIKRLKLWDLLHKLFPVTFIKTADLDPNQNYIFGSHPHGFISYGSAMSFLVYEKHFQKLFPGITVRMCGHNVFASIPLLREFMIPTGLCSVDKESIEYILTKIGVGNAAGIVIGGGREFYATAPYKMDLKLKNRKGFVKLALKHGVSLVPCISFGENEFLAEPNNPFTFILDYFRQWSKKGFFVQIICAPFFNLLYILFNSITIIKRFVGYTKHIYNVVGKPIKVMKNDNPTEKEIDEIHQLYIKEVTDLFYKTKEKLKDGDKYELSIY